jgi:hypothetical protein
MGLLGPCGCHHVGEYRLAHAVGIPRRGNLWVLASVSNAMGRRPPGQRSRAVATTCRMPPALRCGSAALATAIASPFVRRVDGVFPAGTGRGTGATNACTRRHGVLRNAPAVNSAHRGRTTSARVAQPARRKDSRPDTGKDAPTARGFTGGGVIASVRGSSPAPGVR